MFENRCKRCNSITNSLIMSMFNTEMICFICKDKEEKHPQYKDAENEDIQAIKSGNYNYRGIGKPKDL